MQTVFGVEMHKYKYIRKFMETERKWQKIIEITVGDVQN